MSEFEIVSLRSGIKSIRLIQNQETFHPGIGPMAEARILHVEQQRLAERCLKPGRFVIWDVGLGAAANAIAALETLIGSDGDAMVEMHSFDSTLAPLEFAIQHASDLTYIGPYLEVVNQLVTQGEVQLTTKIRWILHRGDFRASMQRRNIPAPHAIFYDPYSSVSNQEMWTLDHFTQLRARICDETPCLLTNYTGSSAIRVTWLMAGFYVGIGYSVGKKAETTVASNHKSLLESPLTQSWLDKRLVSQSSAPVREERHLAQTISESDFTVLKNHVQFRELGR